MSASECDYQDMREERAARGCRALCKLYGYIYPHDIDVYYTCNYESDYHFVEHASDFKEFNVEDYAVDTYAQLTLVDTYVAPLLMEDTDDIVEEYQMDEEVQPWQPGPPNQFILDEIAAWRTRQALEIPDPTLPPLYNPSTHSETGTPFARPWDAQDDAELLARQEANFNRIRGIVIDKATELLSVQVATSVLN